MASKMNEAFVESAKYLKRLAGTVRRWHADWVALPDMRRSHWEAPSVLFEQYLLDEDVSALISLRCDRLLLWHVVHFGDALLNRGQVHPDQFSSAARYAHASVEFSQAFADRDRGGHILADDAALYLALNVLCGWQDEAASVGNALVKGLDTPMLDLRRTERHSAGESCPQLWFLLQLYCDARQLPLDITNYSYPPDMSPYAIVLADWRTSDLGKVSQWVSAMADFHVKETKPAPGNEFALFDTEDVALFPYEILTWLRLREWAGLTNPDSFDHPLMQLPTAQLPNPVPLPKPETPLLDAVVAKFQQEFPGSFAP